MRKEEYRLLNVIYEARRRSEVLCRLNIGGQHWHSNCKIENVSNRKGTRK
jgi:hypothetical protein